MKTFIEIHDELNRLIKEIDSISESIEILQQISNEKSYEIQLLLQTGKMMNGEENDDCSTCKLPD